MPAITTARGNFWCADHRGDKDGRPLIAIHGAGGSHQSFPQALRQSASLNPVLVNLSGHGKSEGAGHDNIADYALDMIALMDALDVPSAIILGHSMGGAIAQWLALRHSDRVEALIVAGSGAKLTVNPALISGIVTETETTINSLVRWMWAKGTPENLMAESADILRATVPSIVQNDFIACDNFYIKSNLAEINMPTLIIAGESDKMTPPALSQELAQEIVNSELVVLPNAGHMMLMEQPTEAVEAIEQWLARLPNH